jgi:L-asparaginase
MLQEMGLILGGDLPGPKARIKLMVALGVTTEPTELRRLFEGADPPPEPQSTSR